MQRPVAVAMCRMDQCSVTVVAVAAVEYQLLGAAEMSEFVVAVVVAAEVRSAQELQQDHLMAQTAAALLELHYYFQLDNC